MQNITGQSISFILQIVSLPVFCVLSAYSNNLPVLLIEVGQRHIYAYEIKAIKEILDISYEELFVIDWGK